jgi:hypothetical protein
VPDSPESQLFAFLNPTDGGDFVDLQRTLTFQGVPQAIEQGVNHSMWGFAFMLAHSVSREEFERVSELFIRATFSEPFELSATMKAIGGLTPEEDWKSTIAHCLLDFNEASRTVLEELYHDLEHKGEREPAEIVRTFAAIRLEGTPERGVNAEEVQESWCESFLKKVMANWKVRSSVPPPPVAAGETLAESSAVLRNGNRLRGQDRYVKPF